MRQGRSGNEAGKVWERGREGLGTRQGRSGNEAVPVPPKCVLAWFELIQAVCCATYTCGSIS